MVFSSLEFLFWFLPFCLLTYAVAKKHVKNLVLLFFSVAFYAYGVQETPAYLLLITGSVALNYLFGCLIADCPRAKKLWLSLGLLWDFGCLFLFKYADFFIRTTNQIGHTAFASLRLVLPLGISFFTFQISSYLLDVYRGTMKPERSIVSLATYILLFPQLIAGPIVRFSDVKRELHIRSVQFQDFLDGSELFVIGLAKKVLLANQLSGLWRDLDAVGYESISTPAAWMGIVAYSLQIYFDFSGYSQMAIGLGRMFGFHFPTNFRHPYISCSMTEFWRRWHITLGAWFREYVYIPLGGNRKGKARTYLNLLVVWVMTGFWHGADWNFLLWGLLLYILLVIEKAGLGKFLEQHRLYGHLYMMLWIPLSWLVFAVSDLQQIGVYFLKLFGLGGDTLFAADYLSYLRTYWAFIAVGCLFSTRIPDVLYRKLKKTRASVLRYGLLICALSLSVYCMYQGMNDPFLYFRF